MVEMQGERRDGTRWSKARCGTAVGDVDAAVTVDGEEVVDTSVTPSGAAHSRRGEWLVRLMGGGRLAAAL